MKKRERKAYTKEEREMQAIGAIAVNVQRGGSWWLTAGDIANYLKMRPSTHLRLILNSMVAEGKLDSRKEDDPGIAKYRVLYTIPDNDTRKAIKRARSAAKADNAPRTIKINAGQKSFLELVQ